MEFIAKYYKTISKEGISYKAHSWYTKPKKERATPHAYATKNSILNKVSKKQKQNIVFHDVLIWHMNLRNCMLDKVKKKNNNNKKSRSSLMTKCFNSRLEGELKRELDYPICPTFMKQMLL